MEKEKKPEKNEGKKKAGKRLRPASPALNA